MTSNAFKTLIKSAVREEVRSVIREELDFYFSKIDKRLDEVVRVGPGEAPKKSNAYTKIAQEEGLQNKPDFRKKYKGILGQIAEGIGDLESFDDSDEANHSSILDESALKTLAKSEKTQGVFKALTKDYSHYDFSK